MMMMKQGGEKNPFHHRGDPCPAVKCINKGLIMMMMMIYDFH